MSLKDDVKLSVQDLDSAALDQPTIFAHWGEEWAKAIFERDKLKEQISAKRAELDEQIRKDPSSFGLSDDKKPTENWVSAQIDSHEEYSELSGQLSQAQYEVNMMTVAKEACEHRLKSLNILTELYKGNYFSASSKGSISHTTAVEKSQDSQREKLNSNPRLLRRTKND